MVDELNYNGIEFPVTINQINKIEKQNNININVLGFENDYPFPLYISEEKFEAHMELLLISEINEDGESKNHYVLIKDFNKFMFGTT